VNQDTHNDDNREISEEASLRREQEFRSRIIEDAIQCNTPTGVTTTVGFARMMYHMGIRDRNAYFVLHLLETNNEYVVDALVGDNDPFLMIRNITPTRPILSKTFRILAFHNPGHLYSKVLLALLGIIDIAYKTSVDGFSIYPFTLSELNNIGKYLDESRDQFDQVNKVLLRILENLHDMGMGAEDWKVRLMAFQSIQIRLAFFDTNKSLVDIIPEELLTRVKKRKSIEPDVGFFPN